MKLTDLDAEFLRYERHADGHVYLPHVDSIDIAHGVEFLCPKCFVELGGKIGCHAIICWSRSRGTPDTAAPGPGRWRMVGTGLHDLTLDAEIDGGARSVAVTGGCEAHFHVTNGRAA